MGVGNGQMRLFWDVPWDEEFYADAIARSTGDMQRRELQLARATQLLVRNALNRLLGDDIVALERCDTSWVGVYDDRRAAYAAARALRPALARDACDACEIVPLDDGRVLCLSRAPPGTTRGRFHLGWPKSGHPVAIAHELDEPEGAIRLAADPSIVDAFRDPATDILAQPCAPA